MRSDLSQDAIQGALKAHVFGRCVVYLPVCDSTNGVARRLADAGIEHGSLVITDYQTSGRGRLDRRWQAPAGSSLLFSVLLRGRPLPEQFQKLTMLAGLATADACSEVTGLGIALKWPNDLLVGGRKVAGILSELGLTGQLVDHAVVGVGVNVNLDPLELGERLLMPATSLGHELGKPVQRLVLLRAILSQIGRRWDEFAMGVDLSQEWCQRLDTVGRAVRVTSGARTFVGVAEGVDSQGGLRVRTADGHVHTVVAGDVMVRDTLSHPEAPWG